MVLTMTNQNREGTFQGANGVKLYYQSWTPTAARAVLIIVPGHGGHSGVFTRMVEYLTECNYIVYSFDLRGNGRSPGQRGYINNWAEYRADLQAFLNWVKIKQPRNLPWFLIGQSMGGTIALDYVLREPNQLQGLILMAPAIGKVGISPWKLSLAKLLSRVWPGFSLDTGIDFAAGSRDPQVVAALANDPLRHTKGTARLATELFKTIDWIKAHAAKIQIPLLILHGGADRIVSIQSSRNFFERLTLADREIREYSDSYHELHNDLNYREVLADIEDWLNRHLSKSRIRN